MLDWTRNDMTVTIKQESAQPHADNNASKNEETE